MNNLTLAYTIFAIVILHLVLGFVWVIYKFSGKSKKKENSEQSE